MKYTITDPTLQMRKLRLHNPPKKLQNLSPKTASGSIQSRKQTACLSVRDFPGRAEAPGSTLTSLCRGSVEDLERNDGSPDRPYYMSKALLKILGKKNETPPGDKRKK